MAKIKIDPLWTFDTFMNLVYFEGGYFEEATLYDEKQGPQPTIKIPFRIYKYELLPFIEKQEKGILRTDRTEDLKILHRLLDIMEKSK